MIARRLGYYVEVMERRRIIDIPFIRLSVRSDWPMPIGLACLFFSHRVLLERVCVSILCDAMCGKLRVAVATDLRPN